MFTTQVAETVLIENQNGRFLFKASSCGANNCRPPRRFDENLEKRKRPIHRQLARHTTLQVVERQEVLMFASSEAHSPSHNLPPLANGGTVAPPAPSDCLPVWFSVPKPWRFEVLSTQGWAEVHRLIALVDVT